MEMIVESHVLGFLVCHFTTLLLARHYGLERYD
jgi:hypothetical protein